MNAQEVVAGWTFPGSSAEADTGTAENIGREIITIGGTSDIEFKNGFETKAAQASSWEGGTGTKAWVITIGTIQYTNLKLSSRQQSGGTDPGPKFFKLKYSLDEGESWIDIPDGDITVENDWETSFVESLDLPVECENIANVMICWMMVSEVASGSGGNVQAEGKSKIDDIFIYGEKISGLNENIYSNVTIGPNPTTESISISSENVIEEIRLMDISGRVVKKNIPNASYSIMNVEGLKSDLYFIIVKCKGQANLCTKKILIL